jgi:uncharacterized protein (TIGR03437 family)
MKRLGLVALVLVFGLAGSLPAYLPMGRFNTSVTPAVLIPAHYDLSTLPNGTLTYYVTGAKPQALPNNYTVEALITQLVEATRTLSGIRTSALKVAFGGYVSAASEIVLANPMGLVEFTSDMPPGAFATGGALYAIPAGTPQFLPIYGSTLTLPADLSLTNVNSNFMYAALVHEMGHGLGAKHSAVSAVMWQTNCVPRGHLITEDDEALFAALYPRSGIRSSFGSITGRVLSGITAVSMAAVAAFSDTQVIGSQTMPDGTFIIDGLPPGSYRLMIYPLMLGGAPSSSADNAGDPNDLISLRTLSNTKVVINTDIGAALYGGSPSNPASSTTFRVQAGGTADIGTWHVSSRGTTRLEAGLVKTTPTGLSSVDGLWLTAGATSRGYTAGAALDTANLQINFTLSGLSLVAGSLTTSTSSSTASVWKTTARYTVQAAANAQPGSSSLIYWNGDEAYFSPGAMHVTSTAPPQVSTISPTQGAGGMLVTISGANFDSGARVYFAGMPAPVVSRSANALVVRAPYGGPGRDVEVWVGNSDGPGSDLTSNNLHFVYGSSPAPSLSVSPVSAVPEQKLTLHITGTGTHFQDGTTWAGFGSGDVVVDSLSVDSPTAMTVHAHVLSEVVDSCYPLTIMTDEEVLYAAQAINLVARQRPFALRIFSGAFQAGSAGTTLPETVAFQATDAVGVAIPGVSVNFSISGDGRVSPTRVVTDTMGVAETVVTLGSSSGMYMVTATADGFSSAGVPVGVGTSPFVVTYSFANDGQTGLAETELTQPLTLTVYDYYTRSPLSGFSVRWIVLTGNGSVRPLSPVTDALGQVSAVWTLGPAVGQQSVRGVPYGFSQGHVYTATATAGTMSPSVPSNGVVSAAGFDKVTRTLSPGTLASIFGSGLSAAAEGVGLVPGTDLLKSTYGGTQVTFDGILAPLLYASGGQINFQVPFELEGKTSAQLVVTVHGTASAPVTVPLAPASPALFTYNGSGAGPALILNQDYSVNTATKPASVGTMAVLYATGLGPVNPAVKSGQLASLTPPLSYCVNTPTVLIDGQPAEVLYAGLAPTFAGLWQVNVMVPDKARAGAVSLDISVLGYHGNPVTMYVK